MAIKSELALRKKALAELSFPNEEIIQEFLNEPPNVPQIQFCWKQPNLIKFIKQIGHLLQWPEIYCFQKFFPILTRWQVKNAKNLKTNQIAVEPKEIIKKRTVKGVPSLEILWKDSQNLFQGLIPQDQLNEYEQDNPKGLNDLWSTVEPLSAMEEAYPEMVLLFIKSKEKPKKDKKTARRNVKKAEQLPLGSLENLNDLMAATNEIDKSLKKSKVKNITASKQKGIQLIDKFFKQKIEEKLKNTPLKLNMAAVQCSTPVTSCLLDELSTDDEEDQLDMSDIVQGIVNKKMQPILKQHAGRALIYESMPTDLSLRLEKIPAMDDADLITQKRKSCNKSILHEESIISQQTKRFSLDDSFDLLVNKDNHRFKQIVEKAKELTCNSLTASKYISNSATNLHINEQLEQENQNVSYFFNNSPAHEDAFEQAMEISFQNIKSSFIQLSDSE